MKRISTTVDKKTLIFTITSLLVCSFLAIFLLVRYWGNFLASFASILLIIVAIASFIVLVGMALDKAYIEDDILYMQYIFKKSHIRIKEIGYIKLKDDIYYIYDKNNKEVGTINALAIGIDKIIYVFNFNNIMSI